MQLDNHAFAWNKTRHVLSRFYGLNMGRLR